MLKSIAKTQGASELVLESTVATRELGKHAWTMELFWDVPEDDGLTQPQVLTLVRNGAGFIEWDVPDLDSAEQIGIWTKCGRLDDYDGIMGYLPPEAIALLESVGITVGPDHRP